MRRVAVTGLGAVTPLGNDAASTWRAALAGESGIDWIRAFDASELPVKVAAEVKAFDPLQVASAKEARKLERNVLLALGAGREEPLDLTASARLRELRAHALALHDDESRHRVDTEPLDQIGPLPAVDAVELERAVVPSALQNLREESLDAAAAARDAGMEEHEPRLRGHRKL